MSLQQSAAPRERPLATFKGCEKTQVFGGLDPKIAEKTFDNGVKQGAFRCK